MSLKVIADKAGTSISTVSRVLNNPDYHCHDKELEDKIWALAHQINYLPNEFARTLRSGSDTLVKTDCFTIDLLLARFNTVNEDSFFNELFHLLEDELIKQKCLMGEILNTMDITKLEQSATPTHAVPYRSRSKVLSEKQEINTSYISRKEDTGLIIFGKCPRNLIPILKNRYGFIVGIDRNPTDYEYDEVICDGTIAAQTAMDYLLKLGHRTIAYIGDCNYESRYIGYYQSLLNNKIPLTNDLIFPTRQTRDDGAQAMKQLLARESQPSAIFCANDATALGVLDVLSHSHKKNYLPSVISIDNILESANTSPMLTTIDIPKTEMIHFAVQLLIDRRNGYHKEMVRLELPCKLIERESCHYALNEF